MIYLFKGVIFVIVIKFISWKKEFIVMDMMSKIYRVFEKRDIILFGKDLKMLERLIYVNSYEVMNGVLNL